MYDTTFRSPAQDEVLAGVQRAAELAGTKGTAVFDLDGCLFDNRPRQAQIIRCWASENDVVELSSLSARHFQDWSLRNTFMRLGLSDVHATRLAARCEPYWERWFFDDAFVRLDRALPGAARFVRSVAQTGCNVLYLTGRLDRQRPSTQWNLERHGFPTDASGDCLWSKTTVDEPDRTFKLRQLEAIAQMTEMVAFFDNEPAHVNDAKRCFGSSSVVWVDTDHSPTAPVVEESIAVIRGFLATHDPQ